MKALLFSTHQADNKNYRNLLAIIGVFVPIVLYIITILYGKKLIVENFHLESLMAKVIISKILIWCIFFLTILYSLGIEKRKFTEWKDVPYRWPFYIKIIIFTFLAFAVIGIGTSNLLHYLGFSSKTKEDLSGFVKQYPVFIYVASITAGIVEEYIFRGYMMTRIYSVSGSKFWAIIISSIIFSAAHYSYGTAFMLVQPFLFGLVFAVLYFKYRNLKVLIVFHILWDIIIQYL